MNVSPEIDPLIDGYVDGELDADAFARLQSWINAAPANAQRFMRRITMHDALRDAPATDLRTQPAPSARRISLVAPALAIAAALLLTAGAIVVYLLASPDSDPVDLSKPTPIVTLIESTGGVSVADDLGVEGREYPAGVIEQSSGTSEFVLSNRVSVTLTGETRLTVHDPMAASLFRGSATFRCPSDAEGFAVRLPDGSRVVDLGTEFSVIVDGEGLSTTEVLEGVVRIETPSGASVVEVGRTARVVRGVATVVKSNRGGVRVADGTALHLVRETIPPFDGAGSAIRVSRVVASSVLGAFDAEFVVDGDAAVDSKTDRWVAATMDSLLVFEFDTPVSVHGIRIDWGWGDRDDGDYEIVINGSTTVGAFTVESPGPSPTPDQTPYEHPTFVRFDEPLEDVSSVELRIRGRDAETNALAEVTFFGTSSTPPPVVPAKEDDQ